MSRARKIPGAERTQTMLDLVRQHYGTGTNGGAPEYVVIEEIAPGTGWTGGNRWADVLALGCWRSTRYELDGYEIKASKADLKRELSDLAKHQAVARYCDYWWLVVWDETLLEGVDGIPDDWGIMVTVDGSHDTRTLKVHRKATRRTPEPWPKTFVCSLVRNAHQQSPGAAFVARAVTEAHQRAWLEIERQRKAAVNDALGPLKRALYGNDRWRWPAEASDPTKVIEKAVGLIHAPLFADGAA